MSERVSEQMPSASVGVRSVHSAAYCTTCLLQRTCSRGGCVEWPASHCSCPTCLTRSLQLTTQRGRTRRYRTRTVATRMLATTKHTLCTTHFASSATAWPANQARKMHARPQPLRCVLKHNHQQLTLYHKLDKYFIRLLLFLIDSSLWFAKLI